MSAPELCLFCDHPATAEFDLPRGCFVYPQVHRQVLCPQHIINAEPLAGMSLVRIIDQATWDWLVSVGIVSPPKNGDIVILATE